MRHTWGAVVTGGVFALAFLLCALQLVVCFHAGRAGGATALAPQQRPGEPWRNRTEPLRVPSGPREPGRRPLPRQFRGLVPEGGPRPARRASV